MGHDWDVFLDVIQIFGGAYIIYAGIDMKRTGLLSQYSLIGKNVVLSQAPDIPGFIKEMYGKYILCGILFLVPGLISFYLNSKGMLSSELFFILAGILAADLVAFAFFLLRAQKRYLLP